MTADCNCRVNLLVSVSSNYEGTGDDDEVRYARAVCESLSLQFGVGNVVLRSAQTPFEDWISSRIEHDPQGDDSSEPHEAEMLVFLSATPTATSTSCLDRESPVPVLVLDRSSTGVADAALAIAKWCSLSSLKVRRHVQKALEVRKQARRTLDAQLRTTSPSYACAIAACYDAGATVTGDHVSLPGRNRGKVRDRYASGNGKPLLALVTTDRQSGFDRMLAQVPYKGAVLNLTSAFWFQHTAHIVPNHLVSVPHPNVSIVKQCAPFPVEFVVRYVPKTGELGRSAAQRLTF
jgi:SAICAR synthetase